MPLPDANKKSPRVYTNLQNKDLDNVTFANIQATGNPINVEEANEDELRRLVLVNLARLVTAGEWTGLLSAGGAGAPTFGIPSGVSGSSLGTTVSQVGVGLVEGSSSSRNLSDYDTPGAFPIVAQVAGDVSSLTVHVNTAEAGINALVGFYDDDSGAPGSLMGYATISTGSTGYISQTSFSATITLEAGKPYWLVFGNDDNSTSTAALRRLSSIYGFGIVEDSSYEYPWMGWAHSGATTSLPATFTATTGRFFRPLAYYSVT
jgi:hypothetical protein